MTLGDKGAAMQASKAWRRRQDHRHTPPFIREAARKNRKSVHAQCMRGDHSGDIAEVVLVIAHMEGSNDHDGNHHHLPQRHRADRQQRRGLAQNLENGTRFTSGQVQSQGIQPPRVWSRRLVTATKTTTRSRTKQGSQDRRRPAHPGRRL
jgi:hypothetical protein